MMWWQRLKKYISKVFTLALEKAQTQRFARVVIQHKKIVLIVLGSVIIVKMLLFLLKNSSRVNAIYPITSNIVLGIWLIFIVLYGLRYSNWDKVYTYARRTVLGVVMLCLLVILLLAGWYTYLFFPDDTEYLRGVVDEIKYQGNEFEEVSYDLIRQLPRAKVDNPLTSEDRAFLLDQKFKTKDIYIDQNPYNGRSPQNLKYATGKTFFYVYQKNSFVLKQNSSISFPIAAATADKRFVQMDLVYPDLAGDVHNQASLHVYYVSKNGKSKKVLLTKEVSKERKPDITPFKYANVWDAIQFFLKNPALSVLSQQRGWQNVKFELPAHAGELVYEFVTDQEHQYLFVGTPRVYAVKPDKRNEHVNVVYLLFDTLGQNHIDLYEFYDTFKKHGFEDAKKILGERKIITPVIDQKINNICLFDHVITAGEVTRPSITALWTSQNPAKSRLPVFRNIITPQNQQEFYDKRFALLGEELSQEGYLTKQISCNAEGHNVSGIGVDLGFDENHDYTMEASEYTANFEHIMRFLEKNQKRKFFLYAHLNIPHPPRWIPASYAVPAFWDANCKASTSRMLGNIRYMNDKLEQLFQVLYKLRLDKNTMVVITADHSCGPHAYFRGDFSKEYRTRAKLESQNVAAFDPRAIYVRKGGQHLNKEFVQIPFVVIPPENVPARAGRIKSWISTLDVAPTFLDILTGKKNAKFAGKSFAYLFNSNHKREGVHNNFMPMVGRFMRGIVKDGRYKYWINLQGIYKYRNRGDQKWIQQQEYLFDLKEDPYEINNLVDDYEAKDLLVEMRKEYFHRFEDYDDKNFIQINPAEDNKPHSYYIKVTAHEGRILYHSHYGDNASIQQSDVKTLILRTKVKDARTFFSFDLEPSDAPLDIAFYRDGKLMKKRNVYYTVEKINISDNPLQLRSRREFFVARTPGRAGLDPVQTPPGSIYFSRIPLNYWLEMSKSEKDIMLSPGIKEVLRGWGYIQ